MARGLPLMMKISKSSSASDSWILLFAGMVLQAPYGELDSLLAKANPSYAFFHEGPVLTVVRAESRKGDCSPWIRALRNYRPQGVILPRGVSSASWRASVQAWEPFKDEERSEVENCDRFPCLVKLNLAETQSMKARPKGERLNQFYDLVFSRVQKYEQTQARKEYEFAGDPVDPWKVIEKIGLKSTLSRSENPQLGLRKVELAPGKVKAIHQVYDWRTSVAPDESSATYWLRDAYVDHFFDGWGEWTTVQCSVSKDSFQVIHAISLELDLMKQSDLFSKMMRPKMVSATEENGKTYLDRLFLDLQKKSTEH